MDLTKLYFFKVTAELRHMTRAAEQLETNQPFLSRSLHKLEEELGVPLFIHKGRGIELSEYGKAYYPYVRDLFAKLEDGKKMLYDMERQEARTVQVGTNACSYLPAFFREVCKEQQQFAVRQRTNSLEALLEGVKEGAYDLVFAVSPTLLREEEGRKALLLRRDEMKLIFPENQADLFGESIAFEQLSDMPIITAPEGFGVTDCLLHQFRIRAKKPNIAIETTDIAIIPKYVENGLGLSAFPAYVLDRLFQSGVGRAELEGEGFWAYFYLVWNPDRYVSRAAVQAIEAAQHYFTRKA